MMRIQKIEQCCNKIIEYSFLSLLLVVPLYFDARASGVFDSTKITVLRFFSIILLTTWLIKIVLVGHQFVRSKLDIPVLAFFWASILSTIFSVYPYTSLVGAYKRHEGLTTTISYILLFFATTNFFYKKDNFNKIIYVIFIVSVISSIYGVIQRFGLDPTNWASNVSARAVSTFGNPIFFGAYLCMCIPLALSYFLRDTTRSVQKPNPVTKKKKKDISQKKREWILSSWVIGGIISLMFAGEIYAMSRGPWVGLTVGMIIFFILAGKSVIILNKYKLLSLSGIFMIIILSTFIGESSMSVADRITETIKLTETSEGKIRAELSGGASHRLKIWERAANIIVDYPVFGIGLDSMKFVYPRYKTILMESLEGHNVDYDRSHNEFLDIGVMRGLVGLIIYLWLLITFIFLSYKAYSKVKNTRERLIFIGLFSAVMAYHAQSFFAFAVCSFTIFFWVLMGMVMIKPEFVTIPNILPENKKKKKYISSIRYGISILIGCAGIYLLVLAYMPYKADIYFRKGEKAIHDNNLDLALKMYEKAVKYNPKERHYYGELTYTYYKKAAAIPMTNKDKKRMWVEKTFDRIKDAFVVNPNDGYFYNILGATYALAYDIDEQESDKQKAFENYRKALKYNIVFAEPHNNMGALYSKLGEYDKAIEEYKEVLKIIPDDVQCMATLGDLYFKKGNMKEAIMWLKKALEINPELLRAHHRLGEIYFSQGKFASSAMCFKRILEIDPKNIRVYADLGAALLRNGQIEEARAAFEYVVRHDPNNLYIRQVLEALP